MISGTIKDLQLYTCSYNPARRAETRGDVLYPVSISIAGSTPESQGLHVEVNSFWFILMLRLLCILFFR